MATRLHPMVFPMMLIFFSPLGIDLFLPALGDVSQAFSVAPSQGQWTISVFVLALGLGQLPFGAAADRFGRRPVSLLGLATFVIGSAICLVADDFYVLLLGRLIQGFGVSATTVCAFTMVRDHYDGAEASGKFSWLAGALNAVPSFAPALGALMTIGFGWRSTFLFYGLVGLAGLCVAWIWQPESRRAMPPDRRKTNGFLHNARTVLDRSESWVPAAVCVMGLSYVITYVSLAPMVLMDRLGIGPVTFSFYFGVNGLVIFLVSFAVPFFNRRAGVGPVTKVGLAFMTLSAVLILLAVLTGGIDAPWQFMGPVALGSIGFAMSFGNAQGRAMDPQGEQAGTASGLLGATQMIIASIAAAVIASVDQGAGAIFGAVFLICFALLTLAWMRRT